MTVFSDILTINNVHIAGRLLIGSCLIFSVGRNLYHAYYDKKKRSDVIKSRLHNELINLSKQNSNNENTVQSTVNKQPRARASDESDSDSEDFSEEWSSESNYASDEDNVNEVDIEDITNNQANTKIGTQPDNVTSHVGFKRKITKTPKSYTDPNSFTEEQITDKLRSDLSKQGYKLIETHAAVKMCRWTKNSMRGRGGCYKHTFYGIKSYQCMEMTPNLACASKCTFCWRHHKNPVGTEWKWKMDEPEIIVKEAVRNHLEMIKQLKGVPGVQKERFEEAQTVRHCALSLVGEPIFYPRINELLEILHSRRISTFLVTNAQFPEAMSNLIPITQLYVSIDAPNKTALKKIDRPLYRDFWERYIKCLEIIKEKKQRTVFRLTLVQKGNMEDLKGYAELIEIGQPDFIEIKGVTYCGTSKANKLTMENVPWHEQVVEFTQELTSLLPQNSYQIACEHSHSNCTLIASTKFLIDGVWHTWIDYEKFFQLIESGNTNFSSLDYVAETPNWSIFGSHEAGFDPEHRRWIRKEHKQKLARERMEQKFVSPSP